MDNYRRPFYLWLAVMFPVFFLLHWNGLLAPVYYWALEATGSTRRFGPQVTAALLSSIVIFAAIAALFEVVARASRRRRR